MKALKRCSFVFALLSRNLSRLLRATAAMAAFWFICMLNLRCLSMVRPSTLLLLLMGIGVGCGTMLFSEIWRGRLFFFFYVKVGDLIFRDGREFAISSPIG